MKRVRIVVALAAVMALAFAIPASAGARDKVGMIDFGNGDPVKGHISIDRGADSVDVNAHLRGLNPGHAFTVWAVIWNDPTKCDSGCGEDDLGVDDNVVIFSGIGGVANGGGNLNGNSTLPSSGGTGPINGGVTETENAEIHFVVQDHGPASDDAATLLAQTTTFEGGCGDGEPPTPPNLGADEDDTCLDVQAAIFLP
jgi:hypothetical protein